MSPRIRYGVSVLAPVWRHVSRQRLSKWQAKCSSKRRIKKIEFLTDILYRFHRFGNVKMPIVRENQGLVLFLDETSSGVMNFKDALLSSSKSSGELYQPVTLWRAGV